MSWYPHLFPSALILSWGICSSWFIISDSCVLDFFMFPYACMFMKMCSSKISWFLTYFLMFGWSVEKQFSKNTISCYRLVNKKQILEIILVLFWKIVSYLKINLNNRFSTWPEHSIRNQTLTPISDPKFELEPNLAMAWTRT